jgi:hypothetical protein
MIAALGCDYVAHRYNYHYWLGTMLVAFQKPDGEAFHVSSGREPIRREKADIQAAFGSYREHMSALLDSLLKIRASGTSLVGYGAAQMLPALAYHLGSDLDCLDVILDDNPEKKGLTYPGIAPLIQTPREDADFSTLGVVVTALDSARYIVERLFSRRPRYLLYPGNIF